RGGVGSLARGEEAGSGRRIRTCVGADRRARRVSGGDEVHPASARRVQDIPVAEGARTARRGVAAVAAGDPRADAAASAGVRMTRGAICTIWFAGLLQAAPEPYAKLCAGCHGDSAGGTERGPSLVDNRALRTRSEKQVHDLIRNGSRGGMPPFALPEEE